MPDLYTPQVWHDLPATDTPLSMARLQHMEDGIHAIDNALQSFSGGSSSVFNALDYGLVGDGVTDDLPAINLALAAIAAIDPSTKQRGAILVLPPRVIRISGPIRLNRCTILAGAGGTFRYGGTKLLVDAGVSAIVLDATTTSTDGGRSEGSLVTDLRIESAGGVSDAIVFKCGQSKVQNFFIHGFGGNGVTIDSTGLNCNKWRLENGRIENCGGDGVYTNGNDANAGVAIAVDSSNNTGWGFHENSFLGNTYVGCHASGNIGGAYNLSDVGASSMLVGCYSESGQPASIIMSASMVLGGTHGAGFDAISTGAIFSGATIGLRIYAKDVSSSALEVRVPSETRQRLRIRGDGSFQWYDGSAATALGITSVDADGTLRHTKAYTTTGLTGATAPTRWVGATATGAPTTGTFAVGDFLTTHDGHLLICTTAGTPGLWKDASGTTQRVPTVVTQSATPTIDTDVTSVAHIIGLAQAITSMTTNLTGTPAEGDTLRVDITDNGTARAITWGASFESGGTFSLPSTTVLGVRMDIGFFWNTVTSKWRVVAVA